MMFVLGLVLFALGGSSLACLFMRIARREPPPTPLRLVQGGHVRVWPAWWSHLDQWRDEA